MDETPEQRAIQEKRKAVRALEKKAATKRAPARVTNALFSRGWLPEPPRFADGDYSIRRRLLRVVLSLLLLLTVGLPMWVIYGLGSGSVAVLGNCGPEGFIGQAGHFAGGSAATLPTAAVIGAILVVGAAIAVWVLRRTAVVVFSFAWLYLMALIVLAVIASSIWGQRHCVLY
jgi:hypothetical protein